MSAGVWLPLLVTCSVCNGTEETTDDEGEINHCRACYDGKQSIALPAASVLRILLSDASEEQQLEQVREMAKNHPRSVHPLLYTVADLPHRFPAYLPGRNTP